jgi:hypothetical protein
MLEFLPLNSLNFFPYNPNLVYEMEADYDNGGGADDVWEEEADDDVDLRYLQKDDDGAESSEISQYKQTVPKHFYVHCMLSNICQILIFFTCSEGASYSLRKAIN